MNIIIDEKAGRLREKYIASFVDKNSTYYVDYIQKRVLCIDGECYLGYLWDCLRCAEAVDEITAVDFISKKEHIYIMWDINSCEYILIEDYWKYPKTAVLEMNGNEYASFQSMLPEDIYIFDESFTWTITLTHEYIGDHRYCHSVQFLTGVDA